MRLIDADELLETFEKYIEPTVCDGLYWGYRHHVVKETILRAKAIEAAPAVHGRWEILDGYVRCSVCGQIMDEDYNYCPNCGAKMDLKGE